MEAIATKFDNNNKIQEGGCSKRNFSLQGTKIQLVFLQFL